MAGDRVPSLLACLVGVGLIAWSTVLIGTPGGSVAVEWSQAAVGASFLLLGIRDWRWREGGEVRIGWLFSGLGLLGAVMVIGLAADASSSRTWARLGWAALVIGFAGSVLIWRTSASRGAFLLLIGAGVVSIAAGAGITLNCDPVLQRSWCDPRFEEEEALLDLVALEGKLEERGRAGSNSGPALAVYQVDPDRALHALVSPPAGFSPSREEPQGVERERAVYRTAQGRFAHCWIRAALRPTEGGGEVSVTTRCQDS